MKRKTYSRPNASLLNTHTPHMFCLSFKVRKAWNERMNGTHASADRKCNLAAALKTFCNSVVDITGKYAAAVRFPLRMEWNECVYNGANETISWYARLEDRTYRFVSNTQCYIECVHWNMRE